MKIDLFLAVDEGGKIFSESFRSARAGSKEKDHKKNKQRQSRP
jgi:hypothetical protein